MKALHITFKELLKHERYKFRNSTIYTKFRQIAGCNNITSNSH